LLQACTDLKSFLYSSGKPEIGRSCPSPATIAELLEPFKHSLEKLSLDVNLDRCEARTDRYQPKLMGSLAHMTALTVLDTVAEIWHGVAEGRIQASAERVYASQEPRLLLRLPPNLETLRFSLSQAQCMISLEHLEDLIRMRVGSLPDLRTLHISYSFYDDLYKKKLRDLLLYTCTSGGADLCRSLSVLCISNRSSTTATSRRDNRVRGGAATNIPHVLGVRFWLGVCWTLKRQKSGYC
jgi:hypothetical protein